MVNTLFGRNALLGMGLMLLLAAGSSFWLIQLNWNLPWTQLFARPSTLPLEALMVQSSLLPRMLMALLVGGALALSTLLLQQVMRNPLASDSTLAVSSGAQTALVIATVFAPGLLAWGNAGVAFGGAALALSMVLLLSAKRRFAPLVVVLAGLVSSLYLGAVSGIITLFYSEETRGLLQWASGSLIQDSWHDSLQLMWRLLAVVLLASALIKPLTILNLSDEQAASLGIPVRSIRLASLLLAAFLSASVVGTVGMLGFIGLAATTVVQQSGVRTLSARMIASLITGALLLLLADNLLMLLHHYFAIELPTGSVTSLLGAPLLLWLIMRTPTRATEPATSSSRHASTIPLRSRQTGWLLLVILPALLLGQGPDGWHLTLDTEIWALRYPRILVALAAGSMLGCAGVLLQRLTRNPMASPELLGISSGTSLGVMTMILAFNLTAGSGLFWLAGIISALITLGLIMLFNHKNGLQPEKILLTGMAVAALSDAAIRAWSAGGDLRIQQLQIWLSGSTYQATSGLSAVMLVLSILILIVCLPLQRWLALLSLDAVIAQSCGIAVQRARLVLVILAALLTALATLLIGPLSFVGLLAPHLANLLGARTPRQQLLGAAILGSSVMVAADWLGRQIGFPYEIPAGLVATLIGGGYFMWIMRKLP